MAQPTASTSSDSIALRGLFWGYGLAALGSIFFSLKGVLIKLAYGPGVPDVDAITVLALRMGFALPFYALFGLWSWRRQTESGRLRPDLRQILIVGGIGLLGYYLASYLDFLGLEFVTAQFERLILYTYPVFVMILGALFFGERITVWGVLALALSYAGIVLVYMEGAIATGERVLLGCGLVLGAALAFALYQLLAKTWVMRVGGRLFTCIAMTAACIGGLAHFVLVTGTHIPAVLEALPARVYGLAATIAVLATIIPSFMLNAALERIGAQALSIVGTLSPVFTIILAVVILHEPFGLTDAAGTVLVILGVGLFTLKTRK